MTAPRDEAAFKAWIDEVVCAMERRGYPKGYLTKSALKFNYDEEFDNGLSPDDIADLMSTQNAQHAFMAEQTLLMRAIRNLLEKCA